MVGSIFLRFCILALVLVECISAASKGNFILLDRSYTIKTTILSLDNGFNVPNVAHLSESYSKELRRARLDYELKDTRINEEFYYDPLIGGNGISLSKSFKSCYKMPLDVLYYNLYLSSEEIKNLLKLVDKNIDNLNYIIGPSKLLYLIANQANKLQIVLNSDGNKPEEVRVRGHSCIQYTLELQLDSPSNEKAQLLILYDKATHSEQSIKTSVPLQIDIKFSQNSKLFLTFAFYSLELFEEAKIHSRFDLANKNELIQVDQFAYPTTYECSTLLTDAANENTGDLFTDYDLSSIRFSFIAKSKPVHGRVIKHFVAYDGMTTSLRIDTQFRTNQETEYEREYVQILDFRTNRKYTYVERPRFKNFKDDEIDISSESFLSLSSGSKEQNSRCSVLYATDPDKAKRDSWNLSKFLTGAQKFTFMGYGRVRGVDARIYESKTDSMPYWLSQPALFKDKNNNYRYKHLGDRIKEDPSKQSKSEYIVVLYIADNYEEIGAGNELLPGIKPLLLEYYDTGFDKFSDYRRSIVIRINDFMWDLNESPNRDQPTDLFSLKYLCSVGSGIDKYAQVDVLLEEMRFNSEEDKNIDWVFNNILRNEALVSSFRDVMDIQNVMMYDLQSKVVEFDKLHKISASFRVAEHPRDVYQLTFIGNAKLNHDNQDKMLIVDSKTITECLWLVGKSKKPIYLYYSQLSSSCIFDIELSESSSSDIRDSRLFIIKDNEAGELYRVESHFDRETSLSNSWLRDKKFTHLENRLMILQAIQHDDPIQPINPNDIRMLIKKVEIDNVNFMNRIGEQGDEGKQIKAAKKVYPGFTLPINDNNINNGVSQTKVFKLKAKNEFMSQEQCHTACLADLNCKSFSYCVQLPDTTCVLSTVSFEAPGIREHLESRDVQNLARGSKVLVKTQDFSIELIRDFRCELYNKIYIDLFERSKSGMFPLKNLIIFPVKNEESCAKMCFAKSLQSIKSSVALGKQIKTLLIEEDNKDNGEKTTELIKQMHDQYFKATLGFCKFFLYLDTTLSAEEQNVLNEIVDEYYTNKTTSESSEYCAFERETNNNKRLNEEKLESFQLLFNNFKFQFKFLYEKRYGYLLERSRLSKEEERAYENVIKQKGLEDGQYELLKGSLKEGKNFQKQLRYDANICAYECFFQHSGLWPACRSFDNLMIRYNIGGTEVENYCYLNTEIDSQNTWTIKDLEVWHYMPRFGAISEEGDYYYDLNTLDEKIDRYKNHDQGNYSGIGGIFKVIFNIFLITFLSSLGILSGLYIGYKLTERFVRGKFDDRIPVVLSQTL